MHVNIIYHKLNDYLSKLRKKIERNGGPLESFDRQVGEFTALKTIKKKHKVIYPKNGKKKFRTDEEKDTFNVLRRSLVASREIKKGEVLKKDMTLALI